MCDNGFWFAPGRELDEEFKPKWSGCPHCAGWRSLMPSEREGPTMNTDLQVPWGTTSTAAMLGSLSGAIVVLLTVIFKMDNDDAVAIAGAVLTLGSFGFFLWGRYAQAKQLAKNTDVIVAEIPER